MNLPFLLFILLFPPPVAAIAGDAVREDIAGGAAGIEITGQIARRIAGNVTEAGLMPERR